MKESFVNKKVTEALDLDSLKYGDPETDFVKDVLSGATDAQDIVDMEAFLHSMERMHEVTGKVLNAFKGLTSVTYKPTSI